MSRPDQSFYLAHFTKNAKSYGELYRKVQSDCSKMSAIERLVNILEERTIRSTTMPWTDKKATCFTECPWSSLLQHAKAYSSYGIGFSKETVYLKGGNPAFYVRPELFVSQQWDETVHPFVTPFVPEYASDDTKNRHPFNGRTVDFSKERC